MQLAKYLLNTPLETKTDVSIDIDGREVPAATGEPLLECINRALPARRLPVCYHTQLGPIETCDCCMVEVNGNLACACSNLICAAGPPSQSRVRSGSNASISIQ